MKLIILTGFFLIVSDKAINAMETHPFCICTEDSMDDTDEAGALAKINEDLSEGPKRNCSGGLAPALLKWAEKKCMSCTSDRSEKEALCHSYDAWVQKISSKIQPKIKKGKLDLSAKRLESVDYVFNRLQHCAIDAIDLHSNSLTVPGLDCLRSFMPLYRLTRLNLEHNLLDRLPVFFFANIPNCRIISLANNQIRCIERGAFIGAKNCSVNLCGNPIETVQPGAMVVGFNKVIVFHSERLSEDVVNEMGKQLAVRDIKTKLLVKSREISHKLSSLEGYTPLLIIICLLPICSIFIIPIIVVFQLDLRSYKVQLSYVGFTAAVIWLFDYLVRKIDINCEAKVTKNGNAILSVKPREEKSLQRKMFEG